MLPDAATVVDLDLERDRRRGGVGGRRRPCSGVCTCWGAPLGGAS
jgi:hypothetical protein